MKPIVILTTMVRNEHVALPRLLRSAAQVCTHVALTDTGSTDDTVSVAETICAELGLVLVVDRQPWEDFGRSRTKNLEHGRSVAAAIGDPGNCYLLLMDADMEVPPGTAPRGTLPDLAMMAQCDGRAVWWNVRVIRATVPASYIGRTHEYVSHASAMTTLDWFQIADHCDGGCRSDKFERDERLLRLDLAEKNDGRSMFYLAQSLQNMGRKREAMELYDRRAPLQDHPEESWLARLEASRCATGPEQDARAWEAYVTRPWRAEPLADIARRASDAGKHAVAIGVAEIGKKIPFPATESLYCPRDVYQWAFPYVEMISAYYVGDTERGAAACEVLHLTPGTPYSQLAINNGVFYTGAIPGSRGTLQFTPPAGFAPASPCLLRVPEGWIAVIRAVNYRISPEGYFPLIAGGWADRDHPITTRNFLVRYDPTWNPIGAPLELVAPRGCNPEACIVGYEDQRIVSSDADVIVTAGVHCDDSPVGQPELWESTWDIRTGQQLKARKLSQGANIEKNWLPLSTGGYLYGHSPCLTVLDRDGLNAVQHEIPLNLNDFRGSAAPVPYRVGHLYMVHEVGMMPRRTYVHRLVYASADWDHVTVSRPFLLHGKPCMESCFSVNWAPEGLVLSCAHEDTEIYTITVPLDVVAGLIDKGTMA